MWTRSANHPVYVYECMHVYVYNSTAIASIGGVLRWRRRPPSWRTRRRACASVGSCTHTHVLTHVHTLVRLNAARPVFVGIVGTASACNCWYIYIYIPSSITVRANFFFSFRRRRRTVGAPRSPFSVRVHSSPEGILL